MTPARIGIAALLALFGALPGSSARPGLASPPGTPEYGSYSWPLRGPVIRGFEQPPDPYGAGHRGIDIAGPLGSNVVASREGVIAFAGWVGGALFVSIDHPDGVRTTYSWLSELRVRKGQSVTRGELIALSAHGHPEVPEPHLHFGARVGSEYIDPMLLLEGADVSDLIHLAPLANGSGYDPFDLVPLLPAWSSVHPTGGWLFTDPGSRAPPRMSGLVPRRSGPA